MEQNKQKWILGEGDLWPRLESEKSENLIYDITFDSEQEADKAREAAIAAILQAKQGLSPFDAALVAKAQSLHCCAIWLARQLADLTESTEAETLINGIIWEMQEKRMEYAS